MAASHRLRKFAGLKLSGFRWRWRWTPARDSRASDSANARAFYLALGDLILTPSCSAPSRGEISWAAARDRPGARGGRPASAARARSLPRSPDRPAPRARAPRTAIWRPRAAARARSEEHTSELQSQSNLVCRLLLEKKNTE